MKEKSIWTRNFILILFINFSISVGFQMLTPTLPKYYLSLGFSSGAAGVIYGVFVVTSLLIRPFSGKLCDDFNMRRILQGSLLLIAVAVFGYSFSKNVVLLILFRLIHGLGWGLVTTASSTIAVVSLPEKRVGEGIGVFGLGSVMSTAVAPGLGLQLAKSGSYLPVFYVAFAMPALGLLLSAFLQKEKFAPKQKDEDSEKKEKLLQQFIAVPALVPGIMVLLVAISTCSIQTFVAIYAGTRSITNIGLFFTVYACALFFSKPLSGKLVDKVSYGVILFPCMAILAGAFVLICNASALPALLVAAVCYGVGYGGIQPLLQVWSVKSVPPERRGVANSTFFIGLDTGTGLGSLLAGMEAEKFGYSTMYALMIIPIALAAVLFIANCFLQKRKAS